MMQSVLRTLFRRTQLQRRLMITRLLMWAVGVLTLTQLLASLLGASPALLDVPQPSRLAVVETVSSRSRTSTRNPSHKAERHSITPTSQGPTTGIHVTNNTTFYPELSSLLSRDGSKIIGNVQHLLDFAIVGFPKTATTTLMIWISRHPEVQMFSREIHSLKNSNPAELVRLLHSLRPGENFKRGYKAPNDIRHQNSTLVIQKYWPNTNLIVGLRHPVAWFNSYWNFKMANGMKLMPPERMVGPLLPVQCFFHVHLSKWGKTNLTEHEEQELLRSKYFDGDALDRVRIRPTSNKIFLYEISQPFDPTNGRNDAFAKDLSAFLGLDQQLDAESAENPTHLPPMGFSPMYICEDRYQELRNELMDVSRNASLWIRSYFVKHPDVTISSPDQFEALLESWMIDPCDDPVSAKKLVTYPGVPTRNASHEKFVHTYKAWPRDTPLPCFEATTSNPTLASFQNEGHGEIGFLYQKTHKCASTTSAGINLRIARNVANRQGHSSGSRCQSRSSHGRTHDPDHFPYATRFQHRIRGTSFLWTMVRDPQERYLSHFRFSIAHLTQHATSNSTLTFMEFKNWLNSNENGAPNYYSCVLSTNRTDTSQPCPRIREPPEVVLQRIENIFESYDFIGIVERYDESLVVLLLLLGLRLSDILYLKSKSGTTMGRGDDHICYPIPERNMMSNNLKDYLKTSEWYEYIEYDDIVHKAAWASLDRTIEKLGKGRVEETLVKFQAAQRVVRERCEGRVVMPCEPWQVQKQDSETDCLFSDISCGMDCLDDIAKDLDLM